MALIVQTFSCARCKRGEFRSLPGPDGKAFCPWCGDAVAGGVAAPSPPPAVVVAEPPVVEAAPAEDVRVLRERLAELTRRCEQAESGLKLELDKKEGIKRVVAAELGRLGAELSDAKAQLQRRDVELGSAKEELERERKKGVDASALRDGLQEKEKALRRLESELEERRTAARELQESRDAARREVELLHADLAKAGAGAELAELRRELDTHKTQPGTMKLLEAELVDVKAKVQDYRRRLEKERGGFQDKASSLQSELEKRDQRIRDLQLLIKTLGERLNDLTSRRA